MFSEHLHWSSPISYDTETIILPQANILLTAGISKMFEAERFELADNDYIEKHITEFYLDQNADIGDIAHAYLRSHPVPSISVIMLFDDFLYKKGMRFIPPKPTCYESGFYMWAKTHKDYLRNVKDEEERTMIRRAIHRLFQLFHMYEFDSSGKTTFDYLKETGLVHMTEDIYEIECARKFEIDIRTYDILDECYMETNYLTNVYSYGKSLQLKKDFFKNAISNKEIGYSVFTDRFILCHPYLFALTEDDDKEAIRSAYLRTHKPNKLIFEYSCDEQL